MADILISEFMDKAAVRGRGAMPGVVPGRPAGRLLAAHGTEDPHPGAHGARDTDQSNARVSAMIAGLVRDHLTKRREG